MYIYAISSGGTDMSSPIYMLLAVAEQTGHHVYIRYKQWRNRQVIMYIYSISSGETDRSSRRYTLLAVAEQTGHHVYIRY